MTDEAYPVTLLEPGQLFAERYRIERFLAGGGMGAVFVAVHEGTEMQVALKVLRPDILGTNAARERFALEAKVAARVKSEHIVKILDAGTDPVTRLPFLAMELLEGQSLEELVQARGPLPFEQVLEYLRQIARGLDKAHGYTDPDGTKKPIVHRDLKPENLFIVNTDTGAPLVKILDFGIAKVLSNTAGVSQELRGTPLYMAYEQATGEAVTPRTDVWALGLIAFFALTGRSYWRSVSLPEATVASLFSEILSLPTPPASERQRQLGLESRFPPAFDGWLARCLDRDPNNRYPSAGQAVEALALAFAPGAYAETIEVADARALDALRRSDAPPTLESGAGPTPTSSPVEVGNTTGELSSVGSTQNPSLPVQPRRWLLGPVLVLPVLLFGLYLALGPREEVAAPGRIVVAKDGPTALPPLPVSTPPSDPHGSPTVTVTVVSPAATPSSTATPGAVPTETPTPTAAPVSDPIKQREPRKKPPPRPASTTPIATDPKPPVDDPYRER